MIEFNAYYLIGATLMLIGTIIFVRAFVVDRRNRTYHAILVGIAGLAAVAYVLMTFGIGFVTVDGEVINLVQYAEWLVTTPLIILYLGLLAGFARSTIVTLIALDIVVILSGPLAEALPGVGLTYGTYAIGTIAMVILVYKLTIGISEATGDRSPVIVSLFAKLRNLTIAIWAFYPVVWILSPPAMGVLDSTMTLLIYTYLDVVAKVVFGIIALNSQTSMAQLPELDALRFSA